MCIYPGTEVVNRPDEDMAHPTAADPNPATLVFCNPFEEDNDTIPVSHDELELLQKRT